MIQRKQSVFLLLGVLSLAAMALFEAAWITEAAETLVWYVPAILVTGVIVMAVALGAVFLYTNRSRQQKVVVATQVLTLIFMVLLYGGLFLSGRFGVVRDGSNDLQEMVVLALPILAYVLFYLARRGIQADIEPVRSMDRLR